MDEFLILHGPNLNLLGEREPEIYGAHTLLEINQQLDEFAKELMIGLRFCQSNSEGDLIDALHMARTWAKGVVFNPGGYTHTSVAIRDAIASIPIPVVEVHLSNIHQREHFRRRSFLTPVCVGSIFGFGWRSYLLGLQAIVDYVKEH